MSIYNLLFQQFIWKQLEGETVGLLEPPHPEPPPSWNIRETVFLWQVNLCKLHIVLAFWLTGHGHSHSHGHGHSHGNGHGHSHSHSHGHSHMNGGHNHMHDSGVSYKWI